MNLIEVINVNTESETKYLKEKLQSTELYCLEIEEQLERLKTERNEWELRFNGIACELRVFNNHPFIVLSYHLFTYFSLSLFFFF